LYAILKMNRALDRLKLPDGYSLVRYTRSRPESTDRFSNEVGRRVANHHRGLPRPGAWAFCGRLLILIYVLVVGWFQILHRAAGHHDSDPPDADRHSAGARHARRVLHRDVDESASSRVRASSCGNSIIVVDFIELRRREGMPLAEAVIDAGAHSPASGFAHPLPASSSARVSILADPIFQGLGLSADRGRRGLHLPFLARGFRFSTTCSTPASRILQCPLLRSNRRLHHDG